MDPAQRQQVLLVLEAEQLLHVLHVAEIRTGRLFRDHDVGQRELIVRLSARDNQTDGRETQDLRVQRLVLGGFHHGDTRRRFSPVFHRGLHTFLSLGPCWNRPAGGNGTSGLWEPPPAADPPPSELQHKTNAHMSTATRQHCTALCLY